MLTTRTLREELLEVRENLARDRYHYFPDWVRESDLETIADRPLVYLYGGLTDHAMGLFMSHEKAAGFNRLAIVDESRARRGFEGEPVLDLPGFFQLIHQLAAQGSDFVCINFAMEQQEYLIYRYIQERFGLRMLDWAEALRLPKFRNLQIGATNDLWYGLLERFDDFLSAESLLDDEHSKRTLLSAVLYRLTLNREVLWPSSLPLGTSYFYTGCFELGKDEVFADVGAYDGDTLRGFTLATRGAFRHYYGFEPSRENFRKLRENSALLRLPDKQVTLEQKAVAAEAGQVRFVSDKGGGSHIVGDGGPEVGESLLGTGRQKFRVHTVTAVSLDEYFREKEPVTFLKLDIEGEEMAALRGARRLLVEQKPKLAICAYHLPTDIPDILKFLAGLDVGYKLALRHHNNSHWDTVIYAWPESANLRLPRN